MRLIGDIAKNIIPKNDTTKIIHAIQQPFMIKYLDNPILETEAQCSICGGNEGKSCYVDPSKSDQTVWFCTKPNCMATSRLSRGTLCAEPPKPLRSILWPSWCEINGIGNRNRDVKFERIEQNERKLRYLLKFTEKPQGIIVMQGPTGTGKTYAALGTCELFTRTNGACLFFTQETLTTIYQDSFKLDRSGVKAKILKYPLLVIDEFGLREPAPGFLSFFMDMINSRMDWDDRGTIITTNLGDKKLSEFCGDSLMDRLNTGQKFIFDGPTRRTPQPL